MMATESSVLEEAQAKLSFPFNVFLGSDIPVDDFFETFYIAPKTRIASGAGDHLRPEVLKSIGMPGTRIALLGAMGSGKSTFLLNEYRLLRRAHQSGAVATVPYFTTFERLLAGTDELADMVVHPTATVFVDSLDETLPEEQRKRVDGIMTLLMEAPSCILACRTPFFFDALAVYRKRFSFVAEICPLSLDQQESLIKRYLRSLGRLTTPASARVTNKALSLVRRCLGHGARENLLVATPLFSALCAIVALDDNDFHRLAEISEVYGRFIVILTSRKYPGQADAIDNLAELAWELEVHKNAKRSLNADDLSRRWGEGFVERLADLVILRPGTFAGTNVIHDFRHRSMGEFLLAHHLIKDLSATHVSDKQIVELLGTFLNYETTYFVRRLLQDLPAEARERIYRRLRAFLLRSFLLVQPNVVIASHNALYLCSAGDPAFAEVLHKRIVDEQLHVHPLVFGTLLAGLIANASTGNQRSLLKQLDNDAALRRRNMNYHMAYYGDIDPTGLAVMLSPIGRDTLWERTRSILLQRIQTNDEKRRRFRAFDLLTLRHFLVSTGYQLTNAESEIVLKVVDDRNDAWSEFPGLGDIVHSQAAKIGSHVRSHGKPTVEGAPTFGTESVDIGIITTREDEFRAVLGKFHDLQVLVKARHYNVATFVAQDGSTRSVAILRCSEQGNGEAQDAARDLIDDLAPKWIVVTGIAGARPDDDFTLGDVIVATRVFDFSVEAVTKKGREYALTGGPMRKSVVNFVANIAALDSQLGGWSEPSALGMEQPVVELSKSVFYGSAEWRAKVRQKLNLHFTKGRRKRHPIAFAGPIASSDRLIKDDEILAVWLKVTRQVCAIEMETAGVYRAARRVQREYPVLAIRAISDVVGFRRSEDWTRYACEVAAAFTRKIVDRVPIDGG